MSLAKKTKTALDESRTLMMGVQILLGFQLQAPFQNAFKELPAHQRAIQLAVLYLMTLTLGLLITPSARHRIVDDGEATLAINRFIRNIAIATLLLFAGSLGFDLYLAFANIIGEAAGTVVGGFASFCAVGLWLGHAGVSYSEENKMPEEGRTSISHKIEYVLTEARVVLPGVQALLGFQLTIILTEAFQRLEYPDKLTHGLALFCSAISTALLIAPAAIHRVAYRGEDHTGFHRTASVLVLGATMFLALGLSIDVFVVTKKITDSRVAGLCGGLTTAALLISLWQIWPWFLRWRAGTGVALE